ncbi:MAG: DUF3899 domain-containing protein [Clostridia bacterium]|nr:DUF3899 domain-containing protein [Clostridia bacterium]
MKPNTKRYVISISVGLFIACVVMLTRNIFEETDINRILVILNDAFFISGICLVCAGGLVFVSDGGMFRMLGYGISMVFTARKWNIKDRKYKDYYEYKKAKDENKHSCAYLLLVGLAFIAIAAIFLIWIKL